MMEKRKGLWYPMVGHLGGEQKGTLETTAGTPWWPTE